MSRLLSHRILEGAVPGPELPEQRATHLRGLGEWPHALSALMQEAHASPTEGHWQRIEALRADWRLADGDADAGNRLGGSDFKRLLQVARAAAAANGTDFRRDAWHLREAMRRSPDDRRVHLLLALAYLGGLEDPAAATDPALDGYLGIDHLPELEARLGQLVAGTRTAPLWLIVSPNSSGTWQLRDYVRHLQACRLSRCLIDTHKAIKQRFNPFRNPDDQFRWLAFLHLHRFTDARLIVAGNLHDPVHATVYTLARKAWIKHVRALGMDPEGEAALASPDCLEAVVEQCQALVAQILPFDLGGYFRANYRVPFGLDPPEFQVRHMAAGYFVGFRNGLTLVLTRLADIDTALPAVVEHVLGIDVGGCRPPGDFRITSSPQLSGQVRAIAARIAVPTELAERSLATRFMEQHFLPEQLRAMRDRWSTRST